MDPTRPSSGPVTRDKLIEAAGEIFAEHGLHGASIRDITRRAGANIAAVNYHFHDKFELYAQVLRQAHQGLAAAMKKPLTAETPEGRMRELLAALLRTAFDPTRPAWHRRLLGRELLQPTPALDLMHDLMERPSERLAEAVRAIRPDVAEGRIALMVSSVVAQCLFHVHHGHLAQRMFPKTPAPRLEVLIEHVVDFSLAALRGMSVPTGPRRSHARRAARTGAAGGRRSSARLSS